MKVAYVIILMILCFSCSKDEDADNNNNNNNKTPVTSTAGTSNYNTSIIARVIKDSSGTEAPQANVIIRLFKNSADKTNNSLAVGTGTTGNDGKTTISNLSLDMYYVSAQHPDLGYKYSQTTTPQNTTSFLDFTYY